MPAEQKNLVLDLSVRAYICRSHYLSEDLYLPRKRDPNRLTRSLVGRTESLIEAQHCKGLEGRVGVVLK
jgi:hypothetical protein